MALDSRLEAPGSAASGPEGDLPDALAAEAIEFVDAVESAFHFGPARGILNAVVIGAGAWTIILAAFALTRSIFFG